MGSLDIYRYNPRLLVDFLSARNDPHCVLLEAAFLILVIIHFCRGL